MIDVRFKLRRGTTDEWSSANPILLNGEPAFDTEQNIYKIGDGFSTWSQLPEFVDKLTILQMIDDAVPSGGIGADTRIGEMDDLSTTNKDSVVGAINEINVPQISFALLYDNAKAG